MRPLSLWLAAVVSTTACGRIGYDALVDGGPVDADGDAGPCPAGYTPMSGTCYRVESGLHDWPTAEQDCEADGPGSHLATIIDVAEHYDLHDLATAQSGGAEIWIGYTDRVTEGSFRWVSFGGLDPSTDDCFFGAGGPVNSPTENCVVQRSATMCGDWFVRACDQLLPYICEHDGRSADPGAF